MLTLGPSMANIIQYYGHRKTFGLSVSPNPLHRNPAYPPVVNPDFALRDGSTAVHRLGLLLGGPLAALLRASCAS